MATKTQKCPGCEKSIFSMSGSECWHEECYQAHHSEEPVCLKHKVCRAK